jgi:hypothetical protein
MFWLQAERLRDSQTPKDVSAALVTARVVGLATTLATATKNDGTAICIEATAAESCI